MTPHGSFILVVLLQNSNFISQKYTCSVDKTISQCGCQAVCTGCPWLMGCLIYTSQVHDLFHIFSPCRIQLPVA